MQDPLTVNIDNLQGAPAYWESKVLLASRAACPSATARCQSSACCEIDASSSVVGSVIVAVRAVSAKLRLWPVIV